MHILLRAVVAALLGLGWGLAPAAAQAPSGGLTVYAAASLKNALDEVDAAFARSRGGAPVTASYAASSTLARQIEQGAPADVFISADVDWMDYLTARKLVRPETRANLLTNRLALVAAKTSAVKLAMGRNMPIAQALGTGRLAMAGPDVPAGRYGQAALAALGVWDGVKDKTALGENVRAALQFVARGEAPLGIVYDTDAMVEPAVRIVALFPEASHPKILYPVAVTARAANPAAGAYARFLAGAEARAIFGKYGFSKP
ncbi:MAG TPA: molybdate ABC transporter substrate-binding protein [Caulobacteraceae bacterium]|nr:molybdate ABC transporter substrate-binding protein [Caulobacteraceae bacterium]